jgi:hypothetical protein
MAGKHKTGYIHPACYSIPSRHVSGIAVSEHINQGGEAIFKATNKIH